MLIEKQTYIEDRIIENFYECSDIARRFVKENPYRIVNAAELIIEAVKKGNKIMIFGNGGSAADAQHMAAEFVNRFTLERPSLPAIALTTDTSILTSIGNDYNFKDIFSRQIEALGKKGDVAIGISTSGISPNVVNALKLSKKMGIKTIALTGKGGGRIKGVAELIIDVPSTKTPRIQEIHLMIEHTLCEIVEEFLFSKRR